MLNSVHQTVHCAMHAVTCILRRGYSVLALYLFDLFILLETYVSGKGHIELTMYIVA